MTEKSALSSCDVNAPLIRRDGYSAYHCRSKRWSVDAAKRLRCLNDALTLLETGEDGPAERICRALVDHDRHDIEALLLLGLTVGMQGHSDEAAPMLNRVAQARFG